MSYAGSPALSFWRTLAASISVDLCVERLDSLWIVPVVVDGAQQTGGYIVVQPSATPILFIQQESLWPGAINPVDDNLLQTVDIITSCIVSSGVKL
jgi:hypothetical protein